MINSRNSQKNSRYFTKTQEILPKTQENFRKTQVFTNFELEIVVEKRPKKEPGVFQAQKLSGLGIFRGLFLAAVHTAVLLPRRTLQL